MSATESRLQSKIAELRELFDNSFAVPEQMERPAIEHLLAIRVAGDRFAISIGDISGLTVAKGTILSVPSRVPELVGITGIHGVVVPVFSLAALLGMVSGSGQYRWLILSGERQSTIALGVDLVEGHLAIPADEVITPGPDVRAHYIKKTVRDGDTMRGVIDLEILIQQIRGRGRV